MTITIAGVPAPGGSKRALWKHGRIVVFDDAKNHRAWRKTCQVAARDAMERRAVLEGALRVLFQFTMPRPKRLTRCTRPVVRPDTTKLVRAVEDALTGIVWRDDAQITTQIAVKRYATAEVPVGCVVLIAADADQ